MKLYVFSVYDSAAEAYLRPYCAESKGLGVRAFSDAVNDEKSPMFHHAADYTLFLVGEFGQGSGELVGSAPVSLGNALTFREAKP